MTSHEPSYYLGPAAGRWNPRGWDDVASAARDGLLDESSWVELKADVPAANPASNLETARDLASLALDGGLFLVGVRDDKGRAGEVVGAEDVERLADRLVQIAATRVAPPLALRPLVLPDPDNPGRGCLAVAIPASPDAPHMVDSRYWGRSPDGKRPLNDPEVRRLLEARAAREQDFERELTGLADTFDQIPDEHRKAGHVFLLARPLQAPAALPDEVAAAWPQIVTTATTVKYAQWHGLAGVANRLPHPDGPAATSALTNVGAQTEEYVHAALIRDHGHVGEIRAFSGAGTFPTPGGPPAVSTMVMVQLVHQMLMLAEHVGRSELRTESSWRVGLHVTGLKNARPTPRATTAPSYPRETFTNSVTATAADLADRSTALTKLLVAPLLRGLGTDWALRQYSGPDDISRLDG